MKHLQVNNRLSIRLIILIVTGIVLPVFTMPASHAASKDQTDNSMLKKLFEFHTKLAKQGNLESIVKLGSMYERGEGVAKDRNKAIKLYKLAADQGYKPAQKMLANILANKPNNKRTYTIDTIRVPVQRTKPKPVNNKQRELKHKLEQQKAANAAARDELERLRQSQQEEQEKQRRLLDQVESIQKAQEALAQERAKAEAARLELEKLRKQQEEALKKQKALTQELHIPETQGQPQKQKPKQQQRADDTATKKKAFSSDPCNTPAAKFMSTCN